MKSLIGILNRIILAFGIVLIFIPVYFFGGMDFAPTHIKMISFMLSILWFGAYLFGYQKIFKKLVKPKLLKGSSNKTLNTTYTSRKDLDLNPMHRFETSGKAHLPIEDINSIGNKETFQLRVKIFIIVILIALIYFTKVMNNTL